MPLGEVKVKGAVDLSYKLKKEADAIGKNKKLMISIGAFMKRTILTRTAKGLDVRGKRFKAYSPSYKMIREKAGLRTDIVNLFFKGSMLSALTYDARQGSVKVYIQDTEDDKGVNNHFKADCNQQTRQFMGMNKKDETQINRMVREYIARTMKK